MTKTGKKCVFLRADGGFLEFIAYLYVLGKYQCQNRDQRQKIHKKHYYFIDFETKNFKIFQKNSISEKNRKKIISDFYENLGIPYFGLKNTIPVV